MQVTCESIHLFDCDDPTKRLITWPIRSLRRYGQDHGKFTFEAGRWVTLSRHWEFARFDNDNSMKIRLQMGKVTKVDVYCEVCLTRCRV